MDNKRQQHGFTLIELLVVIAIIALLAAILFPVFAKAREKARQTTCLSNEKQMGLAMLQYTGDYDESWPYDTCGYDTGVTTNGCTTNVGQYNGTAATGPTPFNPLLQPIGGPGRWTTEIVTYTKSTDIFQEPSSGYQVSAAVPQNQQVGYWANSALFFNPQMASGGLPGARTEASLADYAASTIVLYDNLDKTPGQFANARYLWYRPIYQTASNGWTDIGTFTSSLTSRQGPHNDIFNALWADGHVKAIKHDALFQQVMPAIAVYHAGTAPFPPS